LGWIDNPLPSNTLNRLHFILNRSSNEYPYSAAK
jgi:hypothetical protein